MSGMFGIFNRNGHPVDKKFAENMLVSMSGWDPDECNLWIDGPVALGHTMLWNTPESKYEYLPLHKDMFILTMDARIDNRDELAKDIELPDRPISEIGDSEFILAAYLKWGEDCPKYLLGDFAFVIWDEKKKQLFCARDHIGIKLFYVYLTDDLFIFGNDIEGILGHSKVPRILDDQIVAAFFKDNGIQTRRGTFFEKIKKLPAATTLTVTKSSINENKYWHIEKSPSIAYDTYEEYVEKLKELFDSAVEVRLRTAFPVASHLSGGIDSSPIAVLSARKLRKRDQKLFAFNWINIPDNDEYEFESWSFSRRIAASENMIHKEFKINPKFIAKLRVEEHNFLTRGTMYYWEEHAIHDMVKEIGARTILSGWGGDELISKTHYAYATNMYKRGKVLATIKHLFYEKQLLNLSWKEGISQMLHIVLPLKIVNMIKILKNKKNITNQIDFDTPIMTKEFSIYMKAHKEKVFPYAATVRKQQLEMYHFGHIQDRIESWALSAFPKKIEYKYPLLDKRIVEFAMGIPEEIFDPQKGIGRHLMINAVANLLPLDIVWFPKPNETKINQSSRSRFIATVKTIQEMYKNKDIQLSNKYVDCKKVRQLLEELNPETSDISKMGDVVVAIQFINSMKVLSEL